MPPGSTDELRTRLKEELSNPSFDPTSGTKLGMVQWIVMLFNLCLSFLHNVHTEIYARIADLETKDDELEARNEALAATLPAHASVAVPAPTTRRCTKCHARGHANVDCRTTDPAAMRKRVAMNQKKKKSARVPMLPPLPLYPFTPTPTPQYSTTAASGPQDFAAFAADAEELRRRRQQSIRDKRRVRRSVPPTTS